MQAIDKVSSTTNERVSYSVTPILIPVDAENSERLKHITGFSSDSLKRLSITENLPLKVRGEGNGARYYLLLEDFQRWASNLRRA